MATGSEAEALTWGSLYLFAMSGCLGHLGLWMMWRGIYQIGMVLTICSCILLPIFLADLPDQEDGGHGQG